MAGRSVPRVFYPRYSTIAGAAPGESVGTSPATMAGMTVPGNLQLLSAATRADGLDMTMWVVERPVPRDP